MEKDRRWAETYLDYMMKEDFESGLDLKMQHFPKSFFKYKCLDTNIISSLRANKIWLSDISTLNDPFECSLQFDNDACLRVYFSDQKFHDHFKKKFGVSLTAGEVKKITTAKDPYQYYTQICNQKGIVLNITPEKQLEVIYKRFAAINEEQSANIRVSCFTENHDSLLMWAHYADQHKGFCLEYDFDAEDQIRAFLQPVVYSDKIRQIGLLEEINMLTNVGSSLVKSKEWAYESEWRITSLKLSKEFPNYVTAPNPLAVYLGTRFEQNNPVQKIEFLDVLNQKQIPVYQMIKHPTEFKLVKVKIDVYRGNE